MEDPSSDYVTIKLKTEQASRIYDFLVNHNASDLVLYEDLADLEQHLSIALSPVANKEE